MVPTNTSNCTRRGLLALVAVSQLVLFGCNGEKEKPAEARVQQETQALIAEQLDAWLVASRALQAAAPLPAERGWDRQQDAAALQAMKASWLEARRAYELIEGAVAPIFPESDAATDARYDDYLAALGAGGDRDPFDGQGVIGMHAIERILWADSIDERVVFFEKALPGYRPASMPSTADEAQRFREKLAARLVTDIEQLKVEFSTLSLDVAFAFRGLIDLAVEQQEKVDLAASGREESRYARTTMRDLRANWEGCRAAYEVFRPWLLQKPDGKAADQKVTAAFERLGAAYGQVSGDDIPAPPASWSSLNPSAADLQTPFGKLFEAVSYECDAERERSLHQGLIEVAQALELPKRVTH